MRYLLSTGLILILVVWGFLHFIEEEELQTPLEANNYERLTSHDELHAFVDRVSSSSGYIEQQQLGTSVEGREIPYFQISNGDFGADPNKLTVLLFAQQHGNEPSGKEASLLLLRDIARGDHDELLDYMDILLVPQVNPDGSDAHERRNAENVDLNRSHLMLNAPETKALHSLFYEWHPEVTLDVHEYQPWSRSWMQHGYIRLFDEQFGTPTNVNTDPEIRRLADEVFLPYADAYLEEKGYTFHNYLIGSPDYIRYSTSSINDGRQSFGMMNTFSLIVEGKRTREQNGELHRRAHGQLAAIESLLEFSAEHKDDIQRVVHEGRAALQEGSTDAFALTMDRERADDPLVIPVQEIEEQDGDYVGADTVTVSIDAHHPTTVPLLETSIPDYYLIPVSESDVVDLLEKHQVEIETLSGGETYSAERYRLGAFESKELANSSYDIPVVNREAITYEAQAGDVLVSTSQLHRNVLATALEPQSKHGLLQYDEFERWRDEAYFPILRISE